MFKTDDNLPPYCAGNPPARNSVSDIISELKVENTPPIWYGLYISVLSSKIKFSSGLPPLTIRAALKSLFDYANHSNADVIVTIDGDGQFLPEEIPKLTKDIEDGKSDIVIGYRFETEKDMPAYRKFGNKILDEVSKKAANLNLRDTQSGFRAYSKQAIKKIYFRNDGFAADSEILIDASEKNLSISEHNVTVLYNTGNKTSTKNPVSHGSGVLISLFELVLMKRPLTFLGIPGLITLVVGIITSTISLMLFNQTGHFSVPTTLVSVVFLTVGIMLILVSGILFSINRTIQSR